MLHLELLRPERKDKYVKDDTAITRPDNRTPTPDVRRESEQQTKGQNEMKKFERKC